MFPDQSAAVRGQRRSRASSVGSRLPKLGADIRQLFSDLSQTITGMGGSEPAKAKAKAKAKRAPKKKAKPPVVEYHDLKDDPYINKPILQVPIKASE